MSACALAISLKIPDNTAYTALVTLQRLGVELSRIERNDVWRFPAGEPAQLRRRIEGDETIFNPNKHRLSVLPQPAPREGEVWIEPFSADPLARALNAKRLVGWQLFGADRMPADHATVEAAVVALLCNPAIERPIYF